MKTPTDLIQVSFHSVGVPRSVFVSTAALERRKDGGCVSEHESDGRLLVRTESEFYGGKWHSWDTPKMLNVKNVIEKGAPLLSKGWQERANAWQAEREREFMRDCGLTH